MEASKNSQEGESRGVASDGAENSPQPRLNRAVSMGAHEILALTEIAESSSEFFSPRRQTTATNNAQAPLDRAVTWGGTHDIIETPANNGGSSSDVVHPEEDEPPTTTDAAASLNRAVSLSAQNILALTRNEESSSDFFHPGGGANTTAPEPLQRSTSTAKKDWNKESSDPIISDDADHSETANENARSDPLMSDDTMNRHAETLNKEISRSYMTEEKTLDRTVDGTDLTSKWSGDTDSTTAQQPQRVQSRPGAFRRAPRSVDGNANGDYGADDSAFFTVSPDAETANQGPGLDVQNRLVDIEVVAAEEEDERIRKQLRIEIMDEAVEAKVVEKRISRGKLFLLGFAAMLVLVGIGTGLALGLGSSSDDSDSQAASVGGVELKTTQAPTASPGPTSTSSSSPSATRCPCFSLEDLLEFRSSLPEGIRQDCGAFGPTSFGINCRSADYDCGFRSRVYCSGVCDVFTEGITACTIVEEDVGLVVDETIEITAAEDMACRQNINAICSQR